MNLSKEDAYEVLELPNDSPFEDVVKRYKFLSLEWFPDKHQNSAASLEKFQSISQALIRLTKPCCKCINRLLTQTEMLTLFQFIFFGNESSFEDDDTSDDDFDDESYESDLDMYGDVVEGVGKDFMFADKGADGYMVSDKTKSEEAMQNAQLLIQEEEREKKKVEKRKAKKKRRKEKKKLEKSSANKNSNSVKESVVNSPEKVKKTQETSSSDSEEDIDPTSAFVVEIANKKKRQIQIHSKKGKEEKTKHSTKNEVKMVEDDTSRVLRSRQLAIRGNEMANLGHYQEAADLFSEAIKLNPDDHRFYGNRSYCFDRLGNFERALKDAEKSITLSPEWAKGFFRKGRALTGLQRYSDAEKCFEEVYRLDEQCEDAVKELAKLRIIQLTEMGFSKEQAEVAIYEHSSVESALESLLSGSVAVGPVRKEADVFLSDDDDDDFLQFSAKVCHTQQPDIKMDPSNPEGHNSLWIGNVQPDVSEKTMRSLFSKYGELLSVKVMPEKFCAFINYKNKSSAGIAMRALQGTELLGINIIIRFPDNSSTIKTGTVLKKAKPSVSLQEPPKPKPSGPVDGEECYFWRTTGCVYGDTCRYKHIKENRGKDKKIWHKTS